jgi:glycosyltransferase involved in cell wall biosynthesis
MDISRDGDIELFGLGNRSTFFSDPDYPLREIDNPPAVDRFRHVMDAFRPDIVHYHNFLGFSLSIADIVKKSGIPSCFTPHNYHLIDPSLYMFRYDKMRSWQNADFFENSDLPLLMPEKSGEYQERISAAQDMLNNKIDLTLAISTKVRDIFAEFGVDRKKMSVVHQMPKYINSIEKISHDKPSRGDKLRIGYLGAVIAHKGAHLLISAAQYLDTSRTECLLFGEINEIYHREIVKLDKKNICHFEGEYSVGDLPEIGRKLDLVVVPSIWQEGAGLVVAESLAMGLPVVAADIGGIPDFVCDGQNGRLFDPERPETLARILVEVQENPGLIEKWHNNCKIPHHFNDYINNIEKLYNELKSDGDIIANEYDLLFKC